MVFGFTASAAMADVNVNGGEAAIVGAEVILRQIATPKHFGKHALKVVNVLLKGSNGSSISAKVASMECEPALGTKDCLIKLKAIDSSRPQGFEDISFDVEAKIIQGRVISGGPVRLEN